MLKKNLAKQLVISLFTFSAACTLAMACPPGSWNGKFTILDSQNNPQSVIHTPTRIKISFISSKTFSFSKGVKINGIVAKDNGIIGYNQDIDTFKAELSKLGEIIESETEEVTCTES